MSATCHPGQHGKQKQPQNIRTHWPPGAKNLPLDLNAQGAPGPWANPPVWTAEGGADTAPTERQTGCYCPPSVHQVCQLLWPFVRGVLAACWPLAPSPESPPAGGCLCLGDLD